MKHDTEGATAEAAAQPVEEAASKPGGIASSLIGPLQMAWLRAAQSGTPRPPVIGRRPSYDDCE